MGEVGEPADRVCSQEPYILQSPGPSRPEPTPIVHVVLVRLISRETATSKQHRAQLISTQTFSGQADFTRERLTPTGNSSGRRASVCAWVRGWPGSCRMGGPGREVTGAEDPQRGVGIGSILGQPPAGARGCTHTLVLTICRLTQLRVSNVETPVWQKRMRENHVQVRKLKTPGTGGQSKAHAQTSRVAGEKPTPSEATLLQLQLKPQPHSPLSRLTLSSPPPSSDPSPFPRPQGSPKAQLPKVWSLDQQQQQPLPAMLNQDLHFHKIPEDSGEQSNLSCPHKPPAAKVDISMSNLKLSLSSALAQIT